MLLVYALKLFLKVILLRFLTTSTAFLNLFIPLKFYKGIKSSSTNNEIDFFVILLI